MPLVFKTYNDSPEAVDIVGVGRLFPFGKGGVPIAQAAESMPELQEKNPDGSVRLDDDGQPVPLTGAKLTAAAKEFADARGFTTVNVNEGDLADLPQEAGVTPEPLNANEAAKQDFAATYGDGLTTVNADPEELVNPSQGAGVPVAPATVQNPALPDPTATGGAKSTPKE